MQAEIAKKNEEIWHLKGAMRADDERLMAAARKAEIDYFGCDTADILADTVIELQTDLAHKDEKIAALINEGQETACINNHNVEVLSQEIATLTAENKQQAEEIRVLRRALSNYNPDHDALKTQKEIDDYYTKREDQSISYHQPLK